LGAAIPASTVGAPIALAFLRSLIGLCCLIHLIVRFVVGAFIVLERVVIIVIVQEVIIVRIGV